MNVGERGCWKKATSLLSASNLKPLIASMSLLDNTDVCYTGNIQKMMILFPKYYYTSGPVGSEVVTCGSGGKGIKKERSGKVFLASVSLPKER